MATKKTVKEKTVKPKVTLEDVQNLVELKVKNNVCPTCEGSGRIPPQVFYHMVSCDNCQGTGMK